MSLDNTNTNKDEEKMYVPEKENIEIIEVIEEKKEEKVEKRKSNRLL